MKTSLLMSALVLVLAGVLGGKAPAGDAPTHEDLLKKMVAALDNLTKTLATITNQESADASKPELKKSATDWVALRAQVDKAPPPSREEKDRLEKEFKPKLEAAQKKLFGEVVRVQIVPGGTEALKEIRGILDGPMK